MSNTANRARSTNCADSPNASCTALGWLYPLSTRLAPVGENLQVIGAIGGAGIQAVSTVLALLVQLPSHALQPLAGSWVPLSVSCTGTHTVVIKPPLSGFFTALSTAGSGSSCRFRDYWMLVVGRGTTPSGWGSSCSKNSPSTC